MPSSAPRNVSSTPCGRRAEVQPRQRRADRHHHQQRGQRGRQADAEQDELVDVALFCEKANKAADKKPTKHSRYTPVSTHTSQLGSLM